MRNARSRFRRFLGISYPNAKDAQAARRARPISEQEARDIAAADAAYRQPPWRTALGGEAGIHGGGTMWNWTPGCIAMEEAAVEELWKVVKEGDVVVIEP